MIWKLILNSLLLGVGLAMDACAVSMANGMNEPKMKLGKTSLIAFMFGFFQALMPMIGWVCVYFAAQKFAIFSKAIPYIALALLGFIGGKMIFEGVKDIRKDKTSCATAPSTEQQISADDAEKTSETDAQTATEKVSFEENKGKNVAKKLTFWVLLTQAIATSIDALSVGFTISDYVWWEALIAAGIIAVVTFAISFGAVFVGKKFGTKLGNKAEIVGGCILIAIGLEIFITGMIEQFA